jgi:hypothetical protein
MSKVYLFAICNVISIHGENVEMQPFYEQLLPLLLSILQIPCPPNSMDLMKLQQGTIDCISLLLYNVIDRVLPVLLELITQREPSAFTVCLVHSITKAFGLCKLSDVLKLAEQSFSVLVNRIEKVRFILRILTC